MQQAIIHTTPTFEVKSYGNGLMYELRHRLSGRSVLFQSEEDTERFRTTLADLTERVPSLSYENAIQIIWDEHEVVADDAPSGHLTPPLACPECGDSHHLYDRADARYDPDLREWVVGDREGTIDCTSCDWEGHEHELVPAAEEKPHG